MKKIIFFLLIITLAGFGGCAAFFREPEYTVPTAFRPLPNVPMVPPDETNLPYSTLPNAGEGSFV